MRKLLFLTALTLLLGACRQKGQFCVEGHITEAADTMLYLEHISLGDGIVAVDSARLPADGAFTFRGDTIGNPEFYRLRIGGQCINLSFDSTETVRVEATLPDMSFGYKVEGSGNCDTIRLLSLKMAQLEQEVRATAENRDYTVQERSDRIDTLVARYKDEVKRRFILDHFGSTASYFACFQMLGGTLLFNPMEDRSDLTWMRAVANAWNEKYPGAPRTQNLINIVTQGKRIQAKPKELVLDIDNEKVRELGIIDMTMSDAHGKPHTLSDLKGQVVLLDFTAFALPDNNERTLLLRELYNKYHDRGLEIYQVSLDADYHFWQQRSEQLPWTCVYCQEGVNSDIVTLYQVSKVPYLFLIDRNCDLQAREENITDLTKAIESLL
ncbi:MAG: AhpC/TSA family protein [Bacteroidaceae bacterium]|nr:AhpC/TSA family protein [Bacteroidaceae bacterium]